MNPNQKLPETFDDGGSMAALRADVPYVHPGATLREYFAASAPPVPDWFEPFSIPDGEPPPQVDLENEIDKRIFRDWYENPRMKVPAHLAEHCRRVFEWRRKQDLARKEAEMEQFFSWRWFYADRMLEKRLEKSRGPITPDIEVRSE